MTGDRRRRRLVAGLAAALLVAGAVVASAPAGAAPDRYAPSIGTVTGTSTVSPVNVPVAITTSRLCPAGTGVVNGFMNSAAAGIVDGIVISANSTDVEALATTGMPLDNNFLGLAQAAGRVLVNGDYEISVVCFPDAFSTPTAQFDGAFTVSGGAGPAAPGTTVTWDVPGQTATTTTLTASPEGSAVVGSAVSLTAVVAPAAAVGSVQFTDGVGAAAVPLGDPVPVVAGAARLSVATLAQGDHVLGAQFLPGAGFLASRSAVLPYVVLGADQQPTQTALTVTPSGTATQGSEVTLTAAVRPADTAGTVTFLDGAAVLGTVAVTAGSATLRTSALDAGPHALTARFSPADEVRFAGSGSVAVALTVVPRAGPTGDFLDLLTVDGADGSVTDPLGIVLVAPSACPGGDALSARVKGPGEWAASLTVPVEGFFREPGSSASLKRLDQVAPIVPGKYQLTLVCTESTGTGVFGFFLGFVWFYDATAWLSQDPAVVGIPTSTALTVAPADRATVGDRVTLQATVDQAAATGRVVFAGERDASLVALGEAVVQDGVARLTVRDLQFGLYYLRATFVPDAVSPPYRGSTAAEVPFAAVRGLPPLPQGGATVRGGPVVGGTLTCSARFRGAASVAYRWERDRRVVDGADRATYRPTAADRGTSLRCRVTATNAGGSTYRVSRAVTVRRG